MTCWASACLAAIAGDGCATAWEAARSAASDHEQHVWRQPSSSTALEKLRGPAHRVGPARHECEDVSNLFGHGQPATVPKLPKPTSSLCAHEAEIGAELWYGPRPCSGQATGTVGARCWLLRPASACSRSRLPRAAGPPERRSRAPRRRRPARREVACRRPRPLLARRAAGDGAERGSTALQAARRRRLDAERAALAPARCRSRRSTRGSPSIGSRSRLRFIYDHGTTSSLDVVMGAKSLERRDDPARRLQPGRAVERRRAAPGAARPSATPIELQRDLASRARTLAATTARGRDDRHRARARAGPTAPRTSPSSPDRRSLDAARIAQLSTRRRPRPPSKSQQLSPAPRARDRRRPGARSTPVVLTAPARRRGR